MADGPDSALPKTLPELVAALALLDTDFPGEAGGEDGLARQPEKRFELRGRRWGPDLLKERVDLLQKTSRMSADDGTPDDAARQHASELIAITDPCQLIRQLLACMPSAELSTLFPAGRCAGFHRALSAVLAAAIGAAAPKEPKQSAGAIYLYDSQFDELVMVASRGFPLDIEPAAKGVLGMLAAAGERKLGTHKSGRPALGPVASLALNVRRLRHCYALQRNLLGRHVWRDEWSKHDWKADVGAEPPRDGELSCNRLLIGVACYRPGKGITGLLFDKAEGPRLERLLFTSKREQWNIAWKTRFAHTFLGNREAERFFRDECLFHRTVGYEQRNEMASGRQVVAGTYEGLQFPHARFIGPFLGGVLRFGGEHLGVIKVEFHRFRKSKGAPTKDALPKQLSMLKSYLRKQPGFFAIGGVTDFILLGYAFSGILYLLKYHHGMDLMETFRRSWLREHPEGER